MMVERVPEVSVVVIGASGFMGRAVETALSSRGASVIAVKAPRIRPTADGRAGMDPQAFDNVVESLSRQIAGAGAVVNAAGIADAGSVDDDALTCANGLLPGVVAAACARASVPRFVHVSSASVQGRCDILDSSVHMEPFSSYSRSKAMGEQQVRLQGSTATVIYRPGGVHGADRSTTRMLAKFSRSALASVAGRGTQFTPQTLVANVGDAIAFLAVSTQTPPEIVAHPSEYLSSGDLLEFLGGKAPREIPVPVARAVVGALFLSGRVMPRLLADARRVEMLWFGQAQAASWLTAVGWRPPMGREQWAKLGQQLRASAGRETGPARSAPNSASADVIPTRRGGSGGPRAGLADGDHTSTLC